MNGDGQGAAGHERTDQALRDFIAFMRQGGNGYKKGWALG
jgi:hypothetical protein